MESLQHAVLASREARVRALGERLSQVETEPPCAMGLVVASFRRQNTSDNRQGQWSHPAAEPRR
jgi:hypothetical protein